MGDFLSFYKNKLRLSEGGYVNDPSDSGGRTYIGISEKNFPNLRLWQLIDKFEPLKRGQFIDDPEVETEVRGFYKGTFWDRLRGDLLAQDIIEPLCDDAVNSGLVTAIIKCQKAAGIPTSGKMDETTINALTSFV